MGRQAGPQEPGESTFQLPPWVSVVVASMPSSPRMPPAGPGPWVLARESGTGLPLRPAPFARGPAPNSAGAPHLHAALTQAATGSACRASAASTYPGA